MAMCFAYQATMVEHLSREKSLNLQSLQEIYDRNFKILLSPAISNIVLMAGADDNKLYEKIYLRQEYTINFEDCELYTIISLSKVLNVNFMNF